MKSTYIRWAVPALVLALAVPAFGGSKSQPNPLQVALLKWSTNTTTSFAVGTLPSSVAFDGANIWVANSADGTVSKLSISRGSGRTFVVGAGALGLAFDGVNIWVGNNTDNTVTKLLARDGTDLGTFTVGIAPVGVAFDGAHILVTNFGSNTVNKL